MVRRKRSREDSAATELPVVESVNALPLQEFVERYIPKDALESKIYLHHKPSEEKDSSENDPTSCEEQQATYSLEIHSSESITQPDFDACFSLIELTSSEAYKHSTVGWSRVKKRKEMKLLDMRYILVRKHSTESSAEHKEGSDVEGFLSFMVTYEDGVEVIYCYEIHLAPSIRNKGMGKRLIALYEGIGRKVGLKKAMLTVFRSNQITLRFYEKLGYAEDEFSPRPKRLRNGVVKEPDYLILSKSLQEEAAKQETGSKPPREI